MGPLRQNYSGPARAPLNPRCGPVCERLLSLWPPRHFPRAISRRSSTILGGENEGFEGRVVAGTVTGIENDMAVIDVGLKSEGRVPLREFAAPGQKPKSASATRSRSMSTASRTCRATRCSARDRARREAAWDKLEAEYAAGNRVDGVIFGRVKGGFTVDLGGAVAFLPGSQVDIRPVATSAR